MKRIFSLVLSCLLVLSLFGICAQPIAATNTNETVPEPATQDPTTPEETTQESIPQKGQEEMSQNESIPQKGQEEISQEEFEENA